MTISVLSSFVGKGSVPGDINSGLLFIFYITQFYTLQASLSTINTNVFHSLLALHFTNKTLIKLHLNKVTEIRIFVFLLWFGSQICVCELNNI